MASTDPDTFVSIESEPIPPDYHDFEPMTNSRIFIDKTMALPRSHDTCDGRHGDQDHPTISISSTSKVAGQTVAPFLSKHIPDQYAPLGQNTQNNPSSKYCYRHRPDLKCRRTANEPSMDNLQRDLESLSSADQQGISHVWSLFSAAPAKHRNLMLQGILTQCCFPQLSYLSTAVSDLIRIDFISALPNELSFKILCYLDTTSLCKAAQVSRSWRAAADDDVVWHKMCEQHIDRKCTKCGWGLPLLERRRLREWKRQQQLRASGRGRNEWSPELTPLPEPNTEVVVAASEGSTGKRALSDAGDSTAPDMKRICASDSSRSDYGEGSSKIQPKFRPWKEVYKDRFKVGTNWKYGRCSTKIFRGHTNGIMCLQFEDNMLATGSYDCTIKIWDIESSEVIRTLRGHQSGIRALQFDDTKLISGSLDRTIKVWNWRTGECISTYQGHAAGVLSVNFAGNLLASGSIDQTVKIWNFEDKSTFSLRGHTEWVNAVKLDTTSRTVFSASDDLTVRLWDLDTRTCIKVYEGHVGQVQQVIPLPSDFEWDENMAGSDKDDDDSEDDSDSASSLPHNIDNLHLEVDENARAAFGEAFGNNRPLPPRYMLTAGLDSTIRLWCVATGKCLKTFFGHVEGVWALASDSLRVVSGAQDRMVKVWDARTGRCHRTFTGHSSAVTCIGLSDSRMITGSEDHEVRLYSFKSEEETAPCREGIDLRWRGRGVTEMGWAEGAVANIWTPG